MTTVSESARVGIIGGGVTGLATAYRLLESGTRDVTVLEAADRVGGCCTTDRVDGFVVERGPNGFIPHVPDLLELAVDVGLEDALIEASPEAKNRFLAVDGVLHPVPLGPLSLVRSQLLSPREKLRLLAEPWIRSDGPAGESVYDFAARRFGERVASTFVAPMVSGVTAGDAREVSVEALFPKLVAWEQGSGSVIRGALEAARSRSRGRPRPRLTTIRGGMARLPERLAERLGERVRLSCGVRHIHRSDTGWEVRVDGRQVERFDALVLATPAYASAELLRPVDAELSRLLDEIPYAGIRVVTLAFDSGRLARPVRGFGFLAGPNAGARVLGSVFTSSIFPEHVPTGQTMLRCFLGGRNDEPALSWGVRQAIDTTRRDLATLMGLRAKPTLEHVTAWPRAIAQYDGRHLDRVAEIEQRAARRGGLFLTGAGFRGVSLNDCARQANEVAQSVVRALPQ